MKRRKQFRKENNQLTYSESMGTQNSKQPFTFFTIYALTRGTFYHLKKILKFIDP